MLMITSSMHPSTKKKEHRTEPDNDVTYLLRIGCVCAMFLMLTGTGTIKDNPNEKEKRIGC